MITKEQEAALYEGVFSLAAIAQDYEEELYIIQRVKEAIINWEEAVEERDVTPLLEEWSQHQEECYEDD